MRLYTLQNGLTPLAGIKTILRIPKKRRTTKMKREKMKTPTKAWQGTQLWK